jgi:hypothetical protein
VDPFRVLVVVVGVDAVVTAWGAVAPERADRMPSSWVFRSSMAERKSSVYSEFEFF